VRRDMLVEAGLDDPQPINTGILFVRASAWGAAFVRAWRQAGDSKACASVRRRPWFEQSCLVDLVLGYRSAWLPDGHAQRIVLLPMLVANSPWGQHARHVWSGIGGLAMRRWAFDAELKAWNTSASAGVLSAVRVVRPAC